jgi:ubiquinone biosynthesis protein
MYPDLKTYEYIKPYGKKIIEEQWSPENVLSEINTRFSQVSGFLSSIPVEVKEILKLTRKGKIHIETELQGYGYLLKKMDSLTNRISITLIIMALIIGASITTTVTFPAAMYTEYGLSYVSLIGYLIAGGLFVILIYAILRRRVYK